jgi:hypothetical protein
MARPQIHVKARVSSDEYGFVPGSPGYCPIANCLKAADPDIISPKVTDKTIIFSRRSTDQRYWYKTPPNAVRYIHAVDAIVKTKQKPDDFDLVLTDLDLIKVKNRLRADTADRVHQANYRDDVVTVVGGKVVVNPKQEAAHRGRQPNRVNSEV